MKHNQFKHIINSILKELCKEHELIMSGVDLTNNTKIIYIYNKHWNCLASINLWMNENRITVEASTDVSKIAGIRNKPLQCDCTYLGFDKVYNMFKTLFIVIGK